MSSETPARAEEANDARATKTAARPPKIGEKGLVCQRDGPTLGASEEGRKASHIVWIPEMSESCNVGFMTLSPAENVVVGKSGNVPAI
jgi:hypothetical protein